MTNEQIKDKKISELLEKYNGFFAYSVDQLNKSKKDGVKYVSRGSGLFHEAGKHKEFDKEFDQILEEFRVNNLKDKGKDKVIEEQLCNFECYYTGDINDAVHFLKSYGFTYKEVLNVYNKTSDKYNN